MDEDKRRGRQGYLVSFSIVPHCIPVTRKLFISAVISVMNKQQYHFNYRSVAQPMNECGRHVLISVFIQVKRCWIERAAQTVRAFPVTPKKAEKIKRKMFRKCCSHTEEIHVLLDNTQLTHFLHPLRSPVWRLTITWVYIVLSAWSLFCMEKASVCNFKQQKIKYPLPSFAENTSLPRLILMF